MQLETEFCLSTNGGVKALMAYYGFVEDEEWEEGEEEAEEEGYEGFVTFDGVVTAATHTRF